MKRAVLFLIALILLFSAVSCNGEGEITTADADITSSADGGELEKNPAPDFTVYNKNGEAVKLSDMKGKPVVLNFWASWCYPCKNEMPEFDQVCGEFEGKVEFMMVNLTDGVTETQEKAEAFISSMGYKFPVYFDKDSDAAVKYGIQSIPTTYFIDAEGNIIAYAVGAIEKEELEQGISMIYTEINDK